MDDRRLYQTILGLSEPWFVSEVEVRPEAEEILVHLALSSETRLSCPECGAASAGYDRSVERRWRHLDTCHYQTVLTARVPRVRCAEHGVKQIAVPWAADRSRFTALFEALAIRLLRETTVSGLAAIMDLSWDEASGILHRAVARGLARREVDPARFVGADERAGPLNTATSTSDVRKTGPQRCSLRRSSSWRVSSGSSPRWSMRTSICPVRVRVATPRLLRPPGVYVPSTLHVCSHLMFRPFHGTPEHTLQVFSKILKLLPSIVRVGGVCSHESTACTLLS